MIPRGAITEWGRTVPWPTVEQIERLASVGCEIARVTAPSQREAENLRAISAELRRRGLRIPLVADIHFTPKAALVAAEHVEKVRINPGNFADKMRSRDALCSDEEYSDELERIVALHGPETVAAVIVEPVAGSTGVLIPPKGYLKRLREITAKHGILLIFDEVIAAFGRLGAPFGATRFGVTPDIITTAKGLTNGVIPMGAVLVRDKIYEAFMSGPEHMIELFHGYTYSGHPVAAAAGLAVMDVYDEEGTFEQARSLEQHFEDLLHSFAGHKHVIDVRNFGLMGVIELAPRDGAPGQRGFEVHKRCFWDENLVVRNGMDLLQFSPFLNSDRDEMEQSFVALRRVLDAVE